MEAGNLFFGNSRGKYLVNRDWQDDFVEFLVECGFGYRGELDEENEKINQNKVVQVSPQGDWIGFENDVFSVFPYYWGDDDELLTKPNFVYKPTGYQLSWYKYPLRDSYMNQQITFEEMEKIMEHCRMSVLIDKEHNQKQIDAIDKKINSKKREIEKLEKKKERFVRALKRANGEK